MSPSGPSVKAAFPPIPISPMSSTQRIKAVTAAETGAALPVLYGGSVNQQNCCALARQSHIDGLFIGRAAWNAAGFIGIVEAVISNLGEPS